MSKIDSSTTIEDLAAIVSQALQDAGIDAVLTGGSVVSIYSENEYESLDLDFVTDATMKTLRVVMAELGFEKSKSRYFRHPKTKFFVEFPSPPLAIGAEPVTEWAERHTNRGTIQILTPTQCVMDRLAAFFHWNDRQALDQAIAVAKRHSINIGKIEDWSRKENSEDRFQEFLEALRTAKPRAS